MIWMFFLKILYGNSLHFKRNVCLDYALVNSYKEGMILSKRSVTYFVNVVSKDQW